MQCQGCVKARGKRMVGRTRGREDERTGGRAMAYHHTRPRIPEGAMHKAAPMLPGGNRMNGRLCVQCGRGSYRAEQGVCACRECGALVPLVVRFKLRWGAANG